MRITHGLPEGYAKKMHMSESKWLSPLEAARHARIGKTRLYQILKTGALRARKLGKKTLIARDELDSLIEGNGGAPTTGGTP